MGVCQPEKDTMGIKNIFFSVNWGIVLSTLSYSLPGKRFLSKFGEYGKVGTEYTM